MIGCQIVFYQDKSDLKPNRWMMHHRLPEPYDHAPTQKRAKKRSIFKSEYVGEKKKSGFNAALF